MITAPTRAEYRKAAPGLAAKNILLWTAQIVLAVVFALVAGPRGGT